MTPDDSAQIDITRVLCIFLMMNSHVGLVSITGDTALSAMVLAAEGFWFNILSRSSVATLGFISGFLLFLRPPSFNRTVRSKFLVLIIPMLVWNAVMVGYDLSRCTIGVEAPFCDPAFWRQPGVVNYLTALAGLPAAVHVWFLRDLFVGTVLLVAIGPVFRRFPWPITAGLFCLLLFASLYPIALRPYLLISLAAGAAASVSGLSLRMVSSPRYAGTAAVVFGLLALAMPGEEMIKRAVLISVSLLLGRFLIDRRVLARLRPLASHAYLAYLLHVPLFMVGLVIQNRTGVRDVPALEVAMYLTMPVLAFAVAIALGRILDHLPRPIQIMARGKVQRSQPHTIIEKGVA